MNPSDEHRKHAQHKYIIEVATISSSRYLKHRNALNPTDTDDTSGAIIIDTLKKNNHTVRYTLLSDDVDMIRHWFAKAMDSNANAIITTGGTGLTPGDVTIEAIRPLFNKEMPGFGEIFRAESIAEIGYAVILTRAIAGVVRGRAVFCMPGSSNAVKLGIKIITAELGHVIEHARGRV
ncbi:MAG: MogA/MoaB family molybdenum cofactor biosynthesis protein [Methanosarcinales archaeon]|nr:MAG: MogA/MoaB family molybdenum cofactor biosynthesis protein [Methanosarcinales archaeon]